MASSHNSLYKGSEELTLECDVCNYQDLTSQAISYCEICTEALCQACDKVHRAAKKTRNHKLLTGDQLLTIPSGTQPVPSLMVCDKHQLPLTHFCKTDGDIVCNRCKITCHRSCSTVDLGTETKKAKSSQMFAKVQMQLKEFEQKCESLQQKRTNDKDILNAQVQSCFDELARIRKEINNVLDELENKLKADIKDVEDEMGNEINEHLVITEDALQEIRESIKHMEESQQDDEMFIAMKKAEGNLTKYEKIMSELEMEMKDICFSLEYNDQFLTQLQQEQPFGKLVHMSPPPFNLTLGKGSPHHMDCDRVFSIVFLPDGHIVLACFEDGLKLLDSKFQFKSKLSMRAMKACMVSDTEVVVTLGKHAKLQYVQVLPTMVPKNEVDVGRVCTGVDYYNNQIYITCHDNPGKGEVQVLDRHGDLQRRLGYDGKNYMFVCPYEVKVNHHGDKIFVTDRDLDLVVCMDQQGGVIYRYTDKDLKIPTSLLLDAHDNILVCGNGMDNVHVVSKSGEKQRLLLTASDMINYPLCVSYRKSDGCLAVGMYDYKKHSLCVFYTQRNF